MSKLTADTITDEQIRDVFASRPDARLLWYDKVNLHETVEPYASIRRDARARCAEIWNARKTDATCHSCGLGEAGHHATRCTAIWTPNARNEAKP